MNDQSKCVSATITNKSGKEEVIKVEITDSESLKSLIESVTELQGKVNEALTKLVEEEKVAAIQPTPVIPGGDQSSSQGSSQEPEIKKPKTE